VKFEDMGPFNLRIRRATTDDFQSLRSLWDSMRLPADELEKRLTEFQVVEADDGQIAGAVGLQIVRQHALLHSEGYADFSIADEARQMFWERIQTIAAHHGVFRIWTQERSPFWTRWGFQPANAETLARLPEEWKNYEGQWFTIQLKNEEVIAELEKELASFRQSEKQHTTQTLDQARTLRNIITVIGFGVGILCLGVLLYLFVHGNPFSR
jgi:N-acetylglutamate synthase-like GNAT family acetyltransferase